LIGAWNILLPSRFCAGADVDGEARHVRDFLFFTDSRSSWSMFSPGTD
jgi:hypothetical protein